MKTFTVIALLVAALTGGHAAAQGGAPKVKALSTPQDATQKTMLVGRNIAGNMIIIFFEFEPAKSMSAGAG